MKYNNSLEIKERRAKLVHRNLEILALAKKEERELCEDEDKELKENEAELDELKENEQELENQINEETPEPATEADEENKNKRNKNTMKTIVSEIRNAMNNGTHKFTIESEERAATVAGFTTGTAPNEVQHNTTVIEQEVKPILEPLYAGSVIDQLGCTVYAGAPMGDLIVPIMTKNQVGWAGETAEASGTQNEFTTVTLHPKRLTAKVDISKMLLATDTIGVENAIRRDILKAIQDKLEATILSADAGNSTKPAGLFYGATETTISTYGDICNLEAALEEANVSGATKYVMNPKVKAYMRNLAKSSKNTQLVFENGEVDGTPAVSTSLVPSKKFAYGNFSDFVVGLWNSIDVVVDEYSQADKGCVRLVVTIFADAVLARAAQIKFGNIA